MIGIFDSGLGGLTILRALAKRFPRQQFLYLGDHLNVPYGDRATDDVIALTRQGVEALFARGAKLVMLGCNTATAVAARPLQQIWLPASKWRGRNVLGIVAPTVEAATQTPWSVSTPQYPQKNNTDLIGVFGTTRTIVSGVYEQEILKRCPKVVVVQQICASLAGEIEAGSDATVLDGLVQTAVAEMIAKTDGAPLHRAILGCTHFPLVEPLFRKHLPAFTRILSQPEIVTDSLDDYLARHPDYGKCEGDGRGVRLLTTGDPAVISSRARVFWGDAPVFEAAEGR